MLHTTRATGITRLARVQNVDHWALTETVLPRALRTRSELTWRGEVRHRSDPTKEKP